MTDIRPPPSSLYSREELISGYTPDDTSSILRTLSFRQFQAYYPIKSNSGLDFIRNAAAASHDARISEALYRFLKQRSQGMRPVGVMGGAFRRAWIRRIRGDREIMP